MSSRKQYMKANSVNSDTFATFLFEQCILSFN
jgi:hypothetical protein